MAVVTWTPDVVTDAGVTVTRHGSLSTSDTYKFRNDGKTRLLVEKSGAGACTLTMVTPATVRGLAVSDKTATIAASTGDVALGPFPPSLYNDENGDMTVSFSEITGITAAVIAG